MSSKENTFCVLPWRHLATHPNGMISLCCRVDFTINDGLAIRKVENQHDYFYNLNQNSIDEILNSESFRKVRLQMLRGQEPPACKECYRDERNGIESKRLRENKQFPFSIEEAQKNTDSQGFIEPHLEFVELRLGNLCNLKCRTCNPYSSSKWTAEYQNLQSELSFVRKYDLDENFNWPDREPFWNELLKSRKTLKMIYINGGEPTLIKKHWEFLEMLTSAGMASQIELKYNTNMTHIKPDGLKIWKNFKDVIVGASIDDLFERNDYIRKGSKWSIIEDNLKTLKSHGFKVIVEQTISAMNCYYAWQTEKWALKNGYGYGCNMVYDPAFLAARALPKVVRDEILLVSQREMSPAAFSSIKAELKFPDSPDLFLQFKNYTKKLDQMRNEKFEVHFLELVELISEKGYSWV